MIPTADGKVTIDTELNNKGFTTGLNTMTKQTSGLTVAVKKLGAAIVAAFAVKSIVNFSKQAIELGSNIAEVQNVVDTAFGDMTYKVEAFASTAIEKFGMSQLAAKKTASTYMAMAKGMGLADEEASNMAISLAGLTGDVASFYNISQELADTKLKAVFTGETESLKDLGIVMTQTNLKAYALSKGITKDMAAMSQAELVGLRYQYVLDQLALANGDFAKTADGWANQTRVLEMQWQEFMSIIGDTLITVLTPLLRVLNQIVSALITAAKVVNSFITGLFGGKQMEDSAKTAQKIGASISDATESQDELTEAVEGTAAAQNKMLAGFDQINKLGSAGAAGGGAGGAGGMAPIEAGINFATNFSEPGGMDDVFSKIKSKIEEFISSLPPELVEFGSEVKKTIETIIKEIGLTAELVWESFVVPTFAKIKGTFNGDFLQGLADTWNKYGVPIFAGIRTAVEKTGKIFRTVWTTFLHPILTTAVDMLVDLYENHIEPFINTLVDFGAICIEAGLQFYNGFIAPIVQGLMEKFLPKFALVISFVLESIGQVLGNVIDFASGVIEVLGGIVTFLTGAFSDDWGKAWDGVKQTFSSVVNIMIDIAEAFVNGFIDGINFIIRGLNSLSLDIPEGVPIVGGTTFGVNIPTISRVTLPRLAQGAVIPPNREFLAVLGDQKSGTNIETPLSTMIEAFRTALREMGYGGNGQNEAYLMLDDEILGKIIYRLYNKERNRVGVKLSET